MGDIVGFLRARLDEDWALADAARRGASGRWQRGEHGAAVSYGDGDDDWPDGGPGDGIVVYDEGAPSDAQCEHIARHDPARVLREVEAKRRIVELHYREDICFTNADGDERDEILCHECDVADEGPAWPCRTLRLVAAIYDTHPDYDPAWRPS